MIEMIEDNFVSNQNLKNIDKVMQDGLLDK